MQIIRKTYHTLFIKKRTELISLFKELSFYLFIALLSIFTLLFGFIFFIFGKTEFLSSFFMYALIIGSIPFWYSLLKDLIYKKFGVDVIAGVAIIGTFFIQQYIAGIVTLLMLSGGQLLEIYAMRKARKELSTLLAKAPSFAHVKSNDSLTDIPIEKITSEMMILIKSGEIIPIDGTIIEGETLVDESTFSGESFPIKKIVGSSVYAGTENNGDVIIVKLEKSAKKTRYESIVALVRNAEKSKAPLVRLADTYSIYFTVLTFSIATLTWVFSHNLIHVVAVLVVATPCPLLLATPIAIISGMSIAAKRGVIVKDGGSLETLSKATAFFFDKTGTLTLGTPKIKKIVSFSTLSEERILTIATSLDEFSTHILARALQGYAKDKELKQLHTTYFKENLGDGVLGIIDNTTYYLGKKHFIETSIKKEELCMSELSNLSEKEGTLVIFLSDNKTSLGAILFEDTIREDASMLFTKLKKEGVEKTILLTGDKRERAVSVAKTLHIQEVVSECLPQDKLTHIQQLKKDGLVVAMVGDGVNDAPALASADIGIAISTHGETAASDAAEIVILSPKIEKVYDITHIAKATIKLAKQGILIGIGASSVAMVFSAFGYIPPLAGVILQEGIDVVVILNALSLAKRVIFT